VAKIPFTCSQCGSDIKLRVSAEPKNLDDLIGASCANCGHPLTEDEVKKQAMKIAENEFKKHFGK
jgi:DNA-directed RNA polymerase subunit RPC12/RpoP